MGGYHTGTFPAVKPPRKVYMDVLRVIATVFVICVHTVALATTYTKAVKNAPDFISSPVSSENVEKVVKPPQIPTFKKSISLGLI